MVLRFTHLSFIDNLSLASYYPSLCSIPEPLYSVLHRTVASLWWISVVPGSSHLTISCSALCCLTLKQASWLEQFPTIFYYYLHLLPTLMVLVRKFIQSMKKYINLLIALSHTFILKSRIQVFLKLKGDNTHNNTTTNNDSITK